MNLHKILASFNLNQIENQTQYSLAKQLILSFLSENMDSLNKQIINQYFDHILNIFDNDNTTSKAKFYNLLILKDISQNGKHKFMSYLSGHPLLAYLYNIAIIIDPSKPIQEKGKKLFRNDPLLGNNYMTLLLECLKFWSQKYQTTKNGQPTKFTKGFDHLKKNRVQIPEIYKYVKVRKNRTKITRQISNYQKNIMDQIPVMMLSRRQSQQQLLGGSYQQIILLKNKSY